MRSITLLGGIAGLGIGLIDLLLRDGLRVGPLQLAITVEFGLRVLGLGCHRGDIRQRLFIGVLRDPDLRVRLLELRFCLALLRYHLLQLRRCVPRIDFDQQLIWLHNLIVIHINPNDTPGDLRCDTNDMGIDEGIVRGFEMARILPPRNAEDDRADQDEGADRQQKWLQPPPAR